MLIIPRPFPPVRRSAFFGGAISYGSVLELCRDLIGNQGSPFPFTGGALTINGETLGNYGMVFKEGDFTVTTGNWDEADWFTGIEDSESAFILVKGNLTIDTGVTFTPAKRKLFTTVYCTGNLTIGGTLSMTARGANHSATGSNVTAAALRIATGTFSAVVNPQVPAAGASGGSGHVSSGGNNQAGNNGGNGTAGATGGGGGGGARGSGATVTSGNGAAGTSFSGGTGGGGAHSTNGNRTAGNGGANGGPGGSGAAGSQSNSGGGGAGNPGGAGAANSGHSANAGDNGTGGVLIVIAEGIYSGSGSVTSSGSDGGDATSAGGGASGGGSVTILSGTDSGPTPTASGGIGGNDTSDIRGGNGGDGTARK
jgi:hypothetical protein